MTIWVIISRLLAATAAGALIGFERGRHGRAAGLRTHISVSLGAAMAAMVGIYMTQSGVGDPSRIASGVVSGVGFLAAGIILVRNSSKVTGLTTAAAMWATTSIGLAFGAGFYIAGAIGTAILMICLTVMVFLERSQKHDRQFIFELADAADVNAIVEEIQKSYPNAHSFDVIPSKSGVSGRVAVTVNINEHRETIFNQFLGRDSIIFILCSG